MSKSIAHGANIAMRINYMRLGCVRLVALAIIVLVIVGLLVLWNAMNPQLANAQNSCGIGQVSPLNQFFNVRPSPNTNQQPIATVVRGTSVPVKSAANGWLELCQGGYVSSSVAVYQTNTPTATVTRTPTRTSTPTNTPTRIVWTATPEPRGTVSPYVIYEYGEDGRLESATLFCPAACEWRIVAETLP